MKERDREYLQQCFLSMLIGGTHSYTEEQLCAWADSLKLQADGKPLLCAVARCAAPGADAVARLKHLCEKILADWQIAGSALIGTNMDVILVLSQTHMLTRNDWLRFGGILSKRMGAEVYLGVGNSYKEWNRLQCSTEEAYEALSWAGAQIAVAHIRDVGTATGVSAASIHNSKKAALDYFHRGMVEALTQELGRLAELVRAGTVVFQDAPYPTSIRRTMVEFLVEMMHIASNTGVDVDEQIGYEDPYRKVFELKSTPEIIQWIAEIAEKLHGAIRARQERMETSLLEKVKEYIHGHLEDIELSLAVVSSQLNMSPNYFSAFFIREAGIGFKEYVTSQRIELAKKYLLETSKSINEISELCGFLSPSYFISVFRNQTGLTPGAYRKQKN